ncbi:MAG: hypothetical protein WDM77_02175 [Steroidobacteraceae bacterium]
MASVWVASSATVPVALAHGAAQVNVKVAPPTIAAIGSLKVAVTVVVLVATPIALSAGVSAVTVGASTAMPGPPRMGSSPPPQPLTTEASSIAAMNTWYRELLRILFIGLPRFKSDPGNRLTLCSG